MIKPGNKGYMITYDSTGKNLIVAVIELVSAARPSDKKAVIEIKKLLFSFENYAKQIKFMECNVKNLYDDAEPEQVRLFKKDAIKEIFKRT